MEPTRSQPAARQPWSKQKKNAAALVVGVGLVVIVATVNTDSPEEKYAAEVEATVLDHYRAEDFLDICDRGNDWACHVNGTDASEVHHVVVHTDLESSEAWKAEGIARAYYTAAGEEHGIELLGVGNINGNPAGQGFWYPWQMGQP